jgi:hypothetical protein
VTAQRDTPTRSGSGSRCEPTSWTPTATSLRRHICSTATTRWKLLQAAGIDLDELRRAGLGPVTLETTVRFVRELHGGQEVDVSLRLPLAGRPHRAVVPAEHRVDDGQLVAGGNSGSTSSQC